MLLPLSDHQHRYPMPAGGLFSTAKDVAAFCQMVLRGGEYQGRRLLSEDAVRQMTARQTPESLPQSYGLGWSTGGIFAYEIARKLQCKRFSGSFVTRRDDWSGNVLKPQMM